MPSDSKDFGDDLCKHTSIWEGCTGGMKKHDAEREREGEIERGRERERESERERDCKNFRNA